MGSRAADTAYVRPSLAALCLLQVVGVAAIGTPAASAAPVNGGPRHLLGTAVDIYTLDGHPEVRDVVERYGFSWMTDPGFMFMPVVLTGRDTIQLRCGRPPDGLRPLRPADVRPCPG